MTAPAVGRIVPALRDRLLSLVDGRHTPEGQVYLAATVGTEVAKAAGVERLEHLAKPLIAPAATAVALRRNRPAPVDTALVLVAGAAYTAGDVVLMLGGGHHGSAARLRRGASAFAVGHVALATVLLRAGVRPRPVHALAQLPALGAAGAHLLSSPGNGPLAAYAGLLTALSVTATSSLQGGDDPARALLAVGGPVFQLSDALILLRRMLRTDSAASRAVDIAVIDTYSLACLLLLTGAAGLARKGDRS